MTTPSPDAKALAVEALKQAKFALEVTDICLRTWNAGQGSPANIEGAIVQIAEALAALQTPAPQPEELRNLARSIAVEFVDAGYGYTMEFNVDLRAHKDAYDAAEDCVYRAIKRRELPSYRPPEGYGDEANHPPEPKPAPDHAELVGDIALMIFEGVWAHVKDRPGGGHDIVFSGVEETAGEIYDRLADALASAPSGVELATEREKFTMHTAQVNAWLALLADTFDARGDDVQSTCSLIMDAASKLAAENARLRETIAQAEDLLTDSRNVGMVRQKLRAALAPADGEE